MRFLLILLGMGLICRGITFAEGGDIESILSASEGMRVAEFTEQQKREMFLKARENLVPISTSAASAEDTTTPPPSPIKAPPHLPIPIKKSSLQKEKFSSSKKSSSHSSAKFLTPPVEQVPLSKKELPLPPTKSPIISRQVMPSPAPFSNESYKKLSLSSPSSQESQQQMQAPIRVVKSGYQKDEGLIPANTNNGKGFFKQRYRYLTPAVKRAIDRASVKRSRWKYVIIHNSGTRQGNARIFDIYHRRVRRMQNGLAYHFVIGNGRSAGNGQIEVGNRWYRQDNGGHVASDYLNNIAIGVCLVGDYNRDAPTPQQLAALEELLGYLRGRVGRFKGRLAIVLGHREINPKPTDCPGKKFPLRWLHRRFPN